MQATSTDRQTTDWEARARALVAALADGSFRSGSELGAAAGVGRAAVWKLVDQLREQGLAVDAVRGRGYRLQAPVELLDPATIETHAKRLGDADVPVKVRFRCSSTNALLLEAARSGAAAGVLATEIQSAGRGRWGRQWVAPFGKTLCLSLLWHLPPLRHGLPGLSLAVAVAVADALNRMGAPVRLKWPNDLLLGGRKLGGILIEIAGEFDGPCAVVIGIGLNLAGADLIAEQADQPVADLAQAVGRRAECRNEVAGAVVAALVGACRQYEVDGFSSFAPQWTHYDALLGEPVVLTLPQGDVRGIARGVDKHGALLLERNGRVETHFSGNLRLRLRRDTAA